MVTEALNRPRRLFKLDTSVCECQINNQGLKPPETRGCSTVSRPSPRHRRDPCAHRDQPGSRSPVPAGNLPRSGSTGAQPQPHRTAAFFQGLGIGRVLYRPTSLANSPAYALSAHAIELCVFLVASPGVVLATGRTRQQIVTGALNGVTNCHFKSLASALHPRPVNLVPWHAPCTHAGCLHHGSCGCPYVACVTKELQSGARKVRGCSRLCNKRCHQAHPLKTRPYCTIDGP